jgi:oxygen-independent coproporphyrinogen-3 oxidase
MKKEFGIYIHIPFCSSICPFCNFNVYIDNKNNHNALIGSMIDEISYMAPMFKEHTLKSIHIGGGTPSLLKVKNLEKIINKIYKVYKPNNFVEICIEINPYKFELENFKNYHNIGINRVSVGIQSFDNKKLKKLGRQSNEKKNLEICEELNKSEISNINYDLIFGVPGETLDGLEYDLNKSIELKPKHISTYLLTIEEDTAFFDLVGKKKFQENTDDEIVNKIELIEDVLKTNNFSQYEISNYAKDTYVSKHNLLYWNNSSYLGIGPGAHSHFVDHDKNIYKRWENYHDVKKYISLANSNQNRFKSVENFDVSMYIKDSIMMGLRLNSGVNIQKLKSVKDFEFDKSEISKLLNLNLIKFENNYLRLTFKGRQLSNKVLDKIINNINDLTI